MKRKHASVDQIIKHLREVEVLQAQGKRVGEACRQLGISEQSYYRWRKEYGTMDSDKAKKLKHLESENDRLKKMVADLCLDNAILREAASGNY